MPDAIVETLALLVAHQVRPGEAAQVAGQPLAAGLQRAQDEALLQGQGHADLDLPGRLGQAVHEGGEALLGLRPFQLGHE